MGIEIKLITRRRAKEPRNNPRYKLAPTPIQIPMVVSIVSILRVECLGKWANICAHYFLLISLINLIRAGIQIITNRIRNI
jgi:hypothetical protein